MNSIMHPLHHGARSIPAEIRPDVTEALERNAQLLAWNRQDLEYIFTVYNRYVAPADEPEDIGCGGCRTKVIGKMKQYAQIWRQAE
jgi:hypothetical protein